MEAWDPALQPPARLALMTMLTTVSQVEFATVRERLDVSDSVLSKHISALVALGYVKSAKGTHVGRRTTRISLTSKGRSALSTHVAALRALIADVQ
jgi:DNA-binding MarR family transcriptional regulator